MLVTNERQFNQALQHLQNPALVCDTETQGLTPYAKLNPSRLCGIAIGDAFHSGADFYFPFRHEEGANLPLELLQPLRELLRGKTLMGHNLAFDVKILHCDGFAIPPVALDTIVASHLADENQPSHALKALAKELFGIDAAKEEAALNLELKSRKLDKGGICKLSAEIVAPYGLADIDLTRRVYFNRMKELEAWKLVPLFHEVNEFLLALIRSEIRGIRLDQDEVRNQLATLGPKIAGYEKRLMELLGDININSPAQVKERLKLPGTARQVLEDELERNPREDVRTLLDYRSLTKAESTYFTPFLERVDSSSRLHTNYKIHGATTGRLSSSEPNLQNISRDQSNRSYSVKKCLVAADGHFLAEFDYSTIEPRIAAHYSQDPDMLAAFRQNKDFHTAVARSMYRKDIISKEERTNAKTLGLGVLYGLGAYRAAVKLGLRHDKNISTGEWEFHYDSAWAMSPEGVLTEYACSTLSAEFCTCSGKQYIKKFYASVPELEPFIKAVRSTAARNGYIRSPISGRCRRFQTAHETYKSPNALIQSTAADILRKAYVALDKEFGDDLSMPRILLTIHDSIVFEIPFGTVANVQVKYIKEVMENTTVLSIPTPVDIKVGINLYNMGEVRV